jgi:hypothetical protein
MVLLSNYRSHVAARFESKGYGRHFVECFLFGLGWRRWRGLLTIIFVRDKIKVLASEVALWSVRDMALAPSEDACKHNQFCKLEIFELCYACLLS